MDRNGGQELRGRRTLARVQCRRAAGRKIGFSPWGRMAYLDRLCILAGSPKLIGSNWHGLAVKGFRNFRWWGGEVNFPCGDTGYAVEKGG